MALLLWASVYNTVELLLMLDLIFLVCLNRSCVYCNDATVLSQQIYRGVNQKHYLLINRAQPL